MVNIFSTRKRNGDAMEKSDQLIHQLYQTTRALSKSLNHLLGEYGLFSSEWTIIKTIKDHGEMTQGYLAERLNIEPAAISRSLAKLEHKMIVGRKSGLDKREKYVFLTPAAIKQYPVWNKIVAEHRERILGDLPEENQAELLLLLDKVYSNVQKEIGY